MKARFAFGLGAVAITMIAACNSHPVTFQASTSSIEYVEKTTVDGSTKLDMLWVIDNSGSMCQEQTILRNNFELFIDKLKDTNLDFHLGVTTSDMNAEYALEPVANPGQLQSTPQPVPGFDSSCHTAVDESGVPIAGDFQPIRDAIAAAVACMTAPDDSYNSVTNADIQCGLSGTPMGCSIGGQNCGGGNAACVPEDLFPPPDAYKTIPKVLKSEEYRDGNGVLDTDSLKADFACMSLVGTRGYGIEKGLAAAVTAVSPELTGGAAGVDGSDTTKPNHGLIREDSRFALVFVTDENDCSHDGTLNETSACGGDVCEYYNAEGVADSPLVPVEDLRLQLMENLSLTKGRTFGDAEILVASIHGSFKRYAGDIPSESECGEPDFQQISPTCASALGKAFSGDRYERFLRQFPPSQYYPQPPANDPNGNLTGWMCTGDFRPALEAIGEFISSVASGCVTRSIYPCDGDGASCPDFPYGGGGGTCTARPGSDDLHYCDSGIQVRARVVTSSLDELRDSGYCIPDSVGDTTFKDGCVVDPSKYEWVGCPGDISGIKLEWNDEVEAKNNLLGTEIQIRYNSQQSG